MNLYQQKPMSVEEYLNVREITDELLECIDGMVYLTASPSTEHQRISRKLLNKWSFIISSKFLTGFFCYYKRYSQRSKGNRCYNYIMDQMIMTTGNGKSHAFCILFLRFLVEILCKSEFILIAIDDPNKTCPHKIYQEIIS